MSNWIIKYNGWKNDEHPLREALCTLGNGNFATRGAAEELTQNQYNYPGTYLAGGYNRRKTKVSGKEIENEDLVNWPNWLFLSFKINNGAWFNLDNTNVLEYIQELSIKEGILTRRMKFEDKEGKITSLISRRLVSLYDKNLAGVEWLLVPENWSGNITVRSGIDGNVFNDGVARYRQLRGDHMKVIKKKVYDENKFFVTSLTKQSKIQVSQAVRTRFYRSDHRFYPGNVESNNQKDFIYQDYTIDVHKLQPIRIEKAVTFFSSHENAIADTETEAINNLITAPSFKRLAETQCMAWKHLWDRSNIDIETDDEEDLKVLRLHIFHLFQTVSEHTTDLDVGVPSRGWHGEAYRGHIFWDEMYIFPFINLHMPQLTRSLLMYRYRRLKEARNASLNEGYRGAMYPWQSGSNGREESQKIHLNPKSGNWIPDVSHKQRHINITIPYNIWQYFIATNDMDFLTSFGAEMFFSIALFWSTKAEMNPKRDRYEIRGVMGPDEYHTKYPDSEALGLNNNAYTNFMVVWIINRVNDILELLDDKTKIQLLNKSGVREEDIEKWKDMSEKMYIPFHDEHIISQFEGYEELKEFDWEAYKKKHGEVMRLDRILETENDTPNRYKASKQADVLMIFYLLSADEILEIFTQLGYDFESGNIPENINYYQKRTSHGSTLSQLVHSWVLARSDRNESWKGFKSALMSDFKDVQGGTTPEGIHLGAMAGTVDLIQRCYAGVKLERDILRIHPQLPEDLKSVNLQIKYRSHWIYLDVNHKKIKITFDKGWAEPVKIAINGEVYTFKKDTSREFELKE